MCVFGKKKDETRVTQQKLGHTVELLNMMFLLWFGVEDPSAGDSGGKRFQQRVIYLSPKIQNAASAGPFKEQNQTNITEAQS